MKFSSIFTIFSVLSTITIAAPVAISSPNAIAISEPDSIPIIDGLSSGLGQGIANISGEVSDITSLLTSSQLPQDSLDQVVTIVVETLQGLLSTVGNITGLDEGTDALNSLLSDTFAKLDNVLDNSGLDETLNQVLDSLIDALKTLLSKLFETIDNVLENLLELNLIGVVVSLLSGALASVDLFLTKIKNGILPSNF